MAVAIQVLDHRHPGIAADPLDQALAAPGDDHIHVLGHGDQFTHGGAVRGLDHLHRRFRQTGGPQPLAHTGCDGLVGADGLGTAPQDGGIAGFQAQTGGIDGHVGTGFVDDADDPEGDSHLAHLNAAGAEAQVADLPHRIGQGRHLVEPLDHGVDPGRGDFKALEQGGIEPAGAAIGHVLAVGAEQGIAAPIEGVGGGQQGAVLGGGAGAGQETRSGPGVAANGDHVGGDIHREGEQTCG